MEFQVGSIGTFITAAAVTTLAGWLGAFFALRKDERNVQIEQVTKQREKWRENMRALTQEIVELYYFNKSNSCAQKISATRAKLSTNLSPKCPHDNKIIEHYAEIFAGESSDIDMLTKRMSLLLKHDWERCKWECTPIYVKPFIRFTKKQREWRSPCYRVV